MMERAGREPMLAGICAIIVGRRVEPARALDGDRPRFTAPTNQQELAARVDELLRPMNFPISPRTDSGCENSR